MINISVLTAALAGECIQFHRKFPDMFQSLVAATKWLPVYSPPLERAYCFVHNLTQYPICTQCLSCCKWESTKKQYSLTCGDKQCRYARSNVTRKITTSGQSNERKQEIVEVRQAAIVKKYGSREQFDTLIRDKRVSTMQDRYGVNYTAESTELRAKMIETNMEKYGVANALCNVEVRDKANRTMQERYGVQWHQLSPNGKATRQRTSLERYGCETPLQSQQIRIKTDITKTVKYGTSTLGHINVAKRQKTIQEKYGVANVKQAHISNDVLALLDDVNWLIAQHHTMQKTLVTIAREIGVDPKTVGQRFKKYDVEIKRFSSSTGERELTEYIQALGLEVEVRSRSIISPYEIDIYIPALSIAIEYCGLYWHSDIHPRMNKRYHVNKLERCTDVGVRLITIFEDEWLNKQLLIKAKIAAILGKSEDKKLNARDCTVSMVKTSELKVLYDHYHIQGTGRGSVCMALHVDNELVGAMSFISHGNGVFELNRFATSCNIRGAFSRLLAHFKREVEWKQIYSYADRRWSEGGVYTLNNFNYTHTTRPSYWYLNQKKTVRLHRSLFRKSQLSKIIEVYDQDLTEFQNCDLNGVLRVWDCGLIRYDCFNHTAREEILTDV